MIVSFFLRSNFFLSFSWGLIKATLILIDGSIWLHLGIEDLLLLNHLLTDLFYELLHIVQVVEPVIVSHYVIDSSNIQIRRDKNLGPLIL